MDSQADIAFVVPPELGGSAFPFGVAILATILRERGYGVAVVDGNARGLSAEQVAAEVAALRPRLAGFTGLSCNYAFIRNTSMLLREQAPATKQIGGGWWCCAIPEFVLNETAIDVVVRGEADLIAASLCETLTNGGDLSAVAGVSYLDDGGALCNTPPAPVPRQIDELPLPAYDLFDMGYYIAPIGDKHFPENSYWDQGSFTRRFAGRTWIKANMYSGRGCYGNCSFCCAAGIGRRNHSPKYVVDHMAGLHDQFGANFFRFTESLTLSTNEWTKAFCQELLSRKLDILYWAQCRGDFHYDDECLDLLKRSGCFHIQIGFESGDDGMLEAMGKRTTVEQHRRIIRDLRKHEIWVTGSFVLNMPGETNDSLAQTVRFVKASRLVQSSGFAVPNPGAELYEYAKANGFLRDEKKLLSENVGKTYGKANFDEYISMFNFNGLAPKALLNAQAKMDARSAVNWFYENSRLLYWGLRLHGWWLGDKAIAGMREAVARRRPTTAVGRALQALHLLEKSRLAKAAGVIKSLFGGRK